MHHKRIPKLRYFVEDQQASTICIVCVTLDRTHDLPLHICPFKTNLHKRSAQLIVSKTKLAS